MLIGFLTLNLSKSGASVTGIGPISTNSRTRRARVGSGTRFAGAQMPGAGVRAGIQALPCQFPAQPDDQRGSSHRDRSRLAVRPPRPRLKRCLAFGLVAGCRGTTSHVGWGTT
jgi:hypothetical protein